MEDLVLMVSWLVIGLGLLAGLFVFIRNLYG